MAQQHIAVIGAAMDLGAGRRGVDMGPSALRVADLHARLRALGHTVEDLGNVEVVQAESEDGGSTQARYLLPIQDACERLARLTEQAVEQRKLPLILGGDHSIAIGSLAGVSAAYRRQGRKLGVLWIDAHADMNTPESSPSGNVHGMPLACCIGLGPSQLTHLCGFAPKVEPRHVALLALRSVDEGERRHIQQTGVHAYTMRDIDERGLRTVLAEALAAVTDGTNGVCLSLDMDALDPYEAPGVGTPVTGGITYREAHLAMELLADSACLASLEVVEVNPVLDSGNRTAQLAVELIASALGKKIL